MSDLEFSEQKENSMGEAFTEGETIDGDAPYKFGTASEVPAFDDAGYDINVQDTDEEETPIEELPIEELKQVRLQRRRVVMQREDTDHVEVGDYIYFIHDEEETGERLSGYYMKTPEWDDFGRPDIITVGVVTGDILNG